MLPIPHDILDQFETALKQRSAPAAARADYRKWLRYFLDFRAKYPLPDSKAEQVRLFAEKLRSKKQTIKQREQAADAVSLFFALQKVTKSISSTAATQTAPAASLQRSAPQTDEPVSKNANAMVCEPPASSLPCPPRLRGGKRYDEWRCLRKTESPAWDKIIENLAAEIKVRHYSRKTLKAYAGWSRKFQGYLKNKPPVDLSAADVKAYLTYLAVRCRVSASTQNQAFNVCNNI